LKHPMDMGLAEAGGKKKGGIEVCALKKLKPNRTPPR